MLADARRLQVFCSKQEIGRGFSVYEGVLSGVWRGVADAIWMTSVCVLESDLMPKGSGVL